MKTDHRLLHIGFDKRRRGLFRIPAISPIITDRARVRIVG